MINIDLSALTSAISDVQDEIKEALNEDGLRAIGFSGAEVLREEAKRNAAAFARTGTLHRNIIVKRLEERSAGANRQTYIVTVRKGRYGLDGDAYYAGFVEFGHKIVPKKPEGVSWRTHRTAAEWEYGGAVVPAKPFMRPAYLNKKNDAVDAMTKKLGEILARNSKD